MNLVVVVLSLVLLVALFADPYGGANANPRGDGSDGRRRRRPEQRLSPAATAKTI
jgi:hypothetical protein